MNILSFKVYSTGGECIFEDQGRNECNHGAHFLCSLFPKSAQSLQQSMV